MCETPEERQRDGSRSAMGWAFGGQVFGRKLAGSWQVFWQVLAGHWQAVGRLLAGDWQNPSARMEIRLRIMYMNSFTFTPFSQFHSQPVGLQQRLPRFFEPGQTLFRLTGLGEAKQVGDYRMGVRRLEIRGDAA